MVSTNGTGAARDAASLTLGDAWHLARYLNGAPALDGDSLTTPLARGAAEAMRGAPDRDAALTAWLDTLAADVAAAVKGAVGLADWDGPCPGAAHDGGPAATALDDPDAFGVLADGFRPTDQGNALRLLTRYGQDLRYVAAWRRWLGWDGARWESEGGEAAKQLAKATIQSLYRLAGEAADRDAREQLATWAMRCEAPRRITAMLEMAATEKGVGCRVEQLDAAPWLLNVANGTLDLRTGELRAPERADLLTKQAPTRYDPAAAAPVWEQFLARVLPDPAVRSYFQRAAGYALTGDVSEQVLFFLYGSGSNGKSTALRVLLEVLGPDYAHQAPPDLLIASKQERHPTELADLFGVRCVTTIEVDDGKRLAEAVLKQLTGGDRIKARRMREDFWEFDPTHKVFLAANHRPVVRGTDWAIWRRIKLIPFTVTIPDAEQDKALPGKLRAEYPGILAWLVRGCLAWQRDGLGEPDAVRAATAAYRADQDVLGQFLDECCVLAEAASVATGELYRAYTRWCEDNGERALSQKALAQALAERGCIKGKGGKGRRLWRGIGFLAEPAREDSHAA